MHCIYNITMYTCTSIYKSDYNYSFFHICYLGLNPCIFNRAEHGSRDTHFTTPGRGEEGPFLKK